MRRSMLAFLLLALAGCATASQTQWVTFPIDQGGKGVPLETWLREHPLKAGQDVSIEEISRGDTASTAIVQIRGRQSSHLHEGHDVIIILLKGRGMLTAGGRNLEVRPGSIVTLPRGTAHSFISKSSEPAVAYALFTPAFDGKDIVPVPEESLVKKQDQ